MNLMETERLPEFDCRLDWQLNEEFALFRITRNMIVTPVVRGGTEKSSLEAQSFAAAIHLKKWRR
jgi:hypothetical protein